jgi:hypothetical protein
MHGNQLACILSWNDDGIMHRVFADPAKPDLGGDVFVLMLYLVG